MKKKSLLLLILSIYLCLFSSFLYSQIIEHPQIPDYDHQTIEKEFRDYLSIFRREDYTDVIGFSSIDEESQMKFGKPIAFYDITRQQIENNFLENKIELNFFNEWWIPLVKNNKTQSFAFFSNKDGKGSIIGFGSKLIADEVAETQAFDPFDDKQGFLISPGSGKFYIKNINNNTVFYPIGYTKRSMRDSTFEYLSISNLNCILYSQSFVRQNCILSSHNFKTENKIEIISLHIQQMIKIINYTGETGILSLYSLQGKKTTEIRIKESETTLQLEQRGLFIYNFKTDRSKMHSGKVMIR
jgi:hypothetical protein